MLYEGMAEGGVLHGYDIVQEGKQDALEGRDRVVGSSGNLEDVSGVIVAEVILHHKEQKKRPCLRMPHLLTSSIAQIPFTRPH